MSQVHTYNVHSSEHNNPIFVVSVREFKGQTEAAIYLSCEFNIVARKLLNSGHDLIENRYFDSLKEAKAFAESINGKPDLGKRA